MRRADGRRFLDRAQSMREQIRSFAETVKPSNDDGPGPMNGEGRASELRVALEELRAQNETLFEACKRLESEMAKYRDLYDGAPDAFVTTDERGVIMDANPAAAKLFGLPSGMLPGRLLIAFVARRDTGPFRHHLRYILEGTGQGAFSVRIRPRGGSPRVAHLTVRIVKGSSFATNGGREPQLAFHWTLQVEPEPEVEEPSPLD